MTDFSSTVTEQPRAQDDVLAIHQVDLANPLTLKDGPLFLLTDQAGVIPPQTVRGKERGLGLYFRDMRYLDEVTLQLNGAPLTPLFASTDLGYRGIRELTNPDLPRADGGIVPKGTVGLHADTTLYSAGMNELLTVRNFGREPVDLDLTLAYDAHFDDMFTVRGVAAGRRGALHAPETHPNGLYFRYDGADARLRATTVTFSPAPTQIENRRASFRFRLDPGAKQEFAVTIVVLDEPIDTLRTQQLGLATAAIPARQLSTAADWDWLGGGVQIVTSNELFNRVLRRSFLDLGMLAMQQGDDRFFAAGVPWYVALFGRDSLITALQTLAYAPGIARTTLDLLARYQGVRDDDTRDEEPGKILHELRVGEMANLREVPFTPYYGTVDATPLFLILLGEYLRWTGDYAYFMALRPHVEAALGWLDHHIERAGGDFLAYAQRAERGLVNQGWKDAYNSIVDADGSLADPPVALVEVQGYVYRARRAMAEAYRRTGDGARATALERQAAALYQRFNERFWLPDLGNFALALHGADAHPAAVDTSNQGQALWGGIIAPQRAGAVRDALLDPARLWAGWGVRTLSHAAVAYNPFDYQSGAIWPHDNALIAVGLRAYGFDTAALQLLTGLYEASSRFEAYRLPELFAGFGRDEYGNPVRYPVACSPQAWSAASLPYLLQSILGLSPDAFERRLHVVRPQLPDWLDWVTVHGVRVGAGRADLRYVRSGDTTMATVLRKEGDLRVTIEY